MSENGGLLGALVPVAFVRDDYELYRALPYRRK